MIMTVICSVLIGTMSGKVHVEHQVGGRVLVVNSIYFGRTSVGIARCFFLILGELSYNLSDTDGLSFCCST